MRFTKVKIDNFYNLKDVDLDLSNGNTLVVGANGSGKSNIVKCVQFLVNRQTLDSVRRRRQIMRNTMLKQNELLNRSEFTNPNEKCSIEVHALLNQGEVKLFSELRVLFLMVDVCQLVCLVAKVFLDEIVSLRVQEKSKLDGKLLFSKLPEGRIEEMIRFSRDRKRARTSVDLDNEYVTSLIVEVTNKLFPGLLEITRSALEQWNLDPECHESDVVMTAHAQKNVDCLEYSLHISEEACRLKLPELYIEKEKHTISIALNDVFGDLTDILHCSITDRHESAIFSNVDEAIRGLCENSYSDVQVEVKLPAVPGNEQHYASHYGDRTSWMVCDEKLLDLLQSTDWGILYTSCWSKLNQRCINTRPSSRKGFFELSARVCLEKSTVNYILPQSRDGMMMEHDEQLLTLNSVEQLLIKTNLSADELVQQRFSKVKDGMNSFCGIKIRVQQKEGAVVQDNNEEAEKIVALSEALQDKDRVSPIESGHRLRSTGCEMMQKAPTKSCDLHVMVKKTTRNEKSTYSHRIPLSGLSGGEIEILMVLCVIHLSGADVVFLDEPGHSLHPPQQAQLSRWIETLQDPDPVCVVVTHSAEFISRKSLSSLYHMAFTGEGFTPFKLSEDSEGGEQQPVPMEDSSASQIVTLSKNIISMMLRPDLRKMFFASGLYFVEGETDKLVLSAVRHHLLKTARDTIEKSMDPRKVLREVQVLEMDHWDILALGGCGNAMKAYKACRELKIPCAIVLDLDAITVKHGKRVKPICVDNWGKSKLHKTLKKEQIGFAASLLGKVDAVFKKVSKEEQLKETQKILQNYGIWIWECGDLESAVCDNPEVREKLPESECFKEAFRDCMAVSLPVSDPAEMQVEKALQHFDRHVFELLDPLAGELRDELRAARQRRCENPSQCVTNHMQDMLLEIGKHKQRLQQHDAFCTRGTKKMSGRANRAPEDEGTTGSPDGNVEMWDRVKHKLHNESGWMNLPWETLCKVVEVCLVAESSPLQDFCRFMKKWQSNGKRKRKVLPQNLLRKLFPPLEEEDED